MSAIFRRELGAFFTSGIAYVFLAVFYLLAGLFFYMYTLSSSTTDMSGMFSMLFAVIIFLIPILTMKSFSEEKKQKTEQGLLTAPVGLGGIVLGKYFATILMYIFGVSIVLIYALIISYFGSVDWGILFSCHALLQQCVYESVSAGIIQTISAGYHSDVLRWSCMAQIRNTGSA